MSEGANDSTAPSRPRLVLLVPTKTYRAEAFVRAAKNLAVDVSLASEKPSALSSFRPVDLLTLNFSEPDRAAAAMRSFASERRVDAVVAVDDQATLAAAAISEALGLPHNPMDAAYATRNKLAMRERLARGGVSQPLFRPVRIDSDLRAIAEKLAYPSVVKPLMMAASRGVIRVDDPAAFAAACKRVAKIIRGRDAPRDEVARNTVLVESFVPGWEVALEGIVTDGKLDVFAIFDKPDPLDGPYFPETIYLTPSRLQADTQQAIQDLAQRAVTAIGLRHGPIHAEIRGDGRNLWTIEVAARSIGGYCSRVLRFEGGASLEDIILRHALDPNVDLPARETGAAGVMMLQAPHAGTLEAVRGTESAREVANIEEVIISAHVGQRLAPLPEGFLYTGFLFARGESTREVEEALRASAGALEFVIDADAVQ